PAAPAGGRRAGGRVLRASPPGQDPVRRGLDERYRGREGRVVVDIAVVPVLAPPGHASSISPVRSGIAAAAQAAARGFEANRPVSAVWSARHIVRLVYTWRWRGGAPTWWRSSESPLAAVAAGS